MTVTNLSGGLPLTVTLTTSDGFAVEPVTFELAPDEARERSGSSRWTPPATEPCPLAVLLIARRQHLSS